MDKHNTVATASPTNHFELKFFFISGKFLDHCKKSARASETFVANSDMASALENFLRSEAEDRNKGVSTTAGEFRYLKLSCGRQKSLLVGDKDSPLEPRLSDSEDNCASIPSRLAMARANFKLVRNWKGVMAPQRGISVVSAPCVGGSTTNWGPF